MGAQSGEVDERFLGRERVGGGGGGPDQHQQEEVCVRCVCACDSGHDDDDDQQRVKEQEEKVCAVAKSVGIGDRVPDLACGRNQQFQEKEREIKRVRAREEIREGAEK